MRFARWLFTLSGIYGLAVLLPQYFLEAYIGRADPPAITHPEHFYGFVGVAVAWQVAFLVIARDPVRYRPLMLVAALAKSLFGVAAVLLFAQHRIAVEVLGFVLIDLGLAALFLIAWWKCRAAECGGKP